MSKVREWTLVGNCITRYRILWPGDFKKPDEILSVKVIEKSAADKLAKAVDKFFESDFQKHVSHLFIDSSDLMEALKEYKGVKV